MGIIFLSNYLRKKNAESPGTLQCPICGPGTRIRYVEDVGPYVKRYRCKKCNLTFRHDRTRYSPVYHPYKSFKKGLKKVKP